MTATMTAAPTAIPAIAPLLNLPLPLRLVCEVLFPLPLLADALALPELALTEGIADPVIAWLSVAAGALPVAVSVLLNGVGAAARVATETAAGQVPRPL